MNGMHYEYVKRKVQDGMLILKCIPNETKHRIVSARDDFFKLVNDLQQNNGGSKKQNAPNSTIQNNLLSDFDGEQYFDILFTNSLTLIRFNPTPFSMNSYTLHSMVEQPPEV